VVILPPLLINIFNKKDQHIKELKKWD